MYNLSGFPAARCDIILLSSSIQYIENYQEILRRIKYLKPKFVWIDRTPMSTKVSNIFVQVNIIKNAELSYPCNIFNFEELRELLSPEYLQISCDECDETPVEILNDIVKFKSQTFRLL